MTTVVSVLHQVLSNKRLFVRTVNLLLAIVELEIHNLSRLIPSEFFKMLPHSGEKDIQPIYVAQAI